uniref:Nonstructural polyprotein n=1 Tax=Darwin bee virus 6 TaxID=2201281 RepID=A0A2U8JQ67_9VIRU|nr:nonstructural polyprotein [Darwin bee virus 6]
MATENLRNGQSISEKQGQTTLFKENFSRRSTNYITSTLYPHIGPRFLNDISNVLDESRISSENMAYYYSFIKGKNVRLLNLNIPLFDAPLEVNFDYCGSRLSYVVDDCKEYSFDFQGWIEHRPKKYWCYVHHENGIPTYFIRNEIDCVGYIGTGKCLNDFKEGWDMKKTLSRSCIESINILPSMHVSAKSVGSDCCSYESTSNYNWLLCTYGNYDVYVQLTDYDCFHLSEKTYLTDLSALIGYTGFVYDSYIEIPNIAMLDGYRFWYWMYNDMNYYAINIDAYFAGSALREQRKRREPYECLEGISSLWPEVTLQGGAFSSLQDTYTSIHEIGKFAQTANSAKSVFDETMAQPWMQNVIHSLTNVASNIARLVREFEAFRADPLGYVKNISKDLVKEFSFPDLELSQAHIGLVIGAAFYLFEKSQILSLGLFMFGYYSVFRLCYHDKFYAQVSSLLVTLVSVGVLKATQLRPVSITLQSNSNLSSMIFAACSFVTLGFATKGISVSTDSVVRHLFNNTKDIFAISRGALSLSKAVEYIIETLQCALNFVFGNTFAYEALVKMTVTSRDLQDYIQYCLTTNPEDLAVKLTMDKESRIQWNRICVLHKDLIKVFASGKPLTETHIGYNMYVRACANYTKLCQEYEKIKHALDHFRPEPFMVWIWGEPGTGKTWSRDRFVNNMYRWHSDIDPLLPDVRKTGLLYVRNPADKYMSRYNGEFAVAYDDVGQNRQLDNPEFNEIMGFGSTNQVKLNMADIEDKGRLFSSSVVIMAANTQFVMSNNLIMKEEAFNRRRHIVVQICRPKLQLDEVNLATSKCDFTKVRIVLSDPLSGQTIVSFPESGYGNDDEEFSKMFQWLGPRYVKHVKEQMIGIENKKDALMAILNGEHHPSIVDLPKELRVLSKDTVDIAKLTKYQKIAQYIGRDDDLDIAIEGIKNCINNGMEPSELMKTHFNDFCRSKDIEGFDDNDWKYLNNDLEMMSEEDQENVKSLWSERFDNLRSTFGWYTLLKWVGIAASGLALFKLYKQFFQSKEEDIFNLQGYNQEVKNPPTKGKVSVQGYSIETKAAPNNRVIIQGESELLSFEPKVGSLTSVVENLSKSVAKFTREKSEHNFAFVNCFNVCYNAWLVPRHFFGKMLSDYLVRIDRQGMRPEVVNIEKGNIFTLCKDGKECDVCLVYLPTLNHGRNHLKHFATRKHLEMVKNFESSMLRWNNDLKIVEKVALGCAERWDVPLEIDADGSELYYSSGYKYNFATSMGDCGSILISNDTTTKARIFGFHFGYNNSENKGMSVHVSREDVELLLEYAIPSIDKIDEEPPKVDLQNAECPPELIDQNGLPYFETFGYVRDAPLPPRDHGDLHRSPLYGEVYPPEKDLSVLNKWDSRLDDEFKGDPDILTRGVIDFAYESRPWPVKELKIATEALKSEFEQFSVPIDKRVLNLDEAINGIWIDGKRVEYSEDINLKTAAGYGLPGIKRDHFNTEEIRNPVTNVLEKIEHRIVNPKLQQQVDDMWKDWMEGKTHSIPWSHTLKIEALKLSKINTGNTRTFCVASTALLLNVRRLFGAFTTAMKKSKIVSFSCLGVDANSRDWNDLYVNLRNTGTHGADMDFFKFDRTAVTWQLARQVCEAINSWYNDSLEYQRARIIAFEEMIFAYGLINKYLTRKVRGNPSGNPLTTELNNCVNYLMLCMVYLLIAKDKKPLEYRIESWKKNVNMKAYGDDIIFTLHPACVEWFDFDLLTRIYSEYGVPVTPADKSDAGIVLRPIHELTFLKRNFRPFDHHEVKWQSALSQSSIRSMIQFYRLKPNNGTMYDAVRTNCMESIIESYHWGEEFFQEHVNKINAWMRNNGYPSIPITYVELDETYRQKLEQGF